MPEEIIDQDQVSENEDTEVQSEENTEVETPQKDERIDPRLIKGLQKGYTQTRQQMSSLDQKLSRIENLISSSKSKDHTQFDPDDVLTVGQFNELIRSQKNAEERERMTANEEAAQYQRIIDEQLDDLKINGAIDDGEEDALLNFALENEIPNLAKAAKLFQKEKILIAGEKKKKEALLIKKEDAGKVGTSNKAGGSSAKGVKYTDIHGLDWDEIQ